MSTLYELDKAIEQVIEHGFAFDEETGEVLFEANQLEELEEAFEKKLESCGCWIKNKRALIEAIKAEEKALSDRRKALERRVDNFSGYVVYCLGKTESGRVDAPSVSLSTRKSTRTIIDDESLLPSSFVEVVTSQKIDKTAIGKALKSGDDVSGAHLETSVNLQVK